ncbi:hypothetical protein FXF51_29210 [Nonomuraea sp. PA05]|uniref:sensor histidine kinase n=1 Tax=Nonomuraea sp. PA05 TaxID=2604466 RepID=UPI0011D6247C|nr:histidine kinase [Nonomuraea sp. PA05]TYB60932.1 hypothetical protein FXF51_29210 [Nonomuraea sp. PA05]
MATDDTRRPGRLHRPLAALSRLSRLGDVPVVIMLAWAGWLAVPWSFSGLAQARAAAAAAAGEAETPPIASAVSEQALGNPAGSGQAQAYSAGSGQAYSAGSGHAQGHSAGSGQAQGLLLGSGQSQCLPTAPGHDQGRPVAWGIPAARTAPPATVRPWPAGTTAPADATAASCLDGGGAEAALVLERARIAGEVHDAAGHGLAAIAMQAGLALVSLDDDPEQARASLRAIRETSTTALAHLRAALDGIDPPAGDLAALIDGVRAAGLPVDLDPPVLAVPAHLRSPVYRVVRESLTNVLRHAGPTRALVRAAGGPHGFVVEVADRGIGPVGSGEGRGLAGMRAKVSEAGGHFAAGPREGGGFRVEARFPQVSA